MDSNTIWVEPMNRGEALAGDRRGGRRYEIQLELRWKLIRRRRVLDTGVGHTVDLSSSGILFAPGCALPVGLNVELSISWPVLLHNVAPLQLMVSGRLVRAESGRAAIRMSQHEFKTVGQPPAQQRVPARGERMPTPFPASFSGLVFGRPQ